MKVLKFGGTSVGSADSIKQVAQIVNSEAQNGRVLVIVSAMSQITNKLLSCSQLAASGDESYKEVIKEIEKKHFEAIRDLVSIEQQSGIIANVKVMLNQLEDMLTGVYLIQELSPKTSDFIVSFGEQLSSLIVSNALKAELIDSRNLIYTNKAFGGATVLYDITFKNIKEYFEQSTKNIFVAPGFVASTEDGITSTLGRGGSDFSAAIYAAAAKADITSCSSNGCISFSKLKS